MLSSYPLQSSVSPEGLADIEKFYSSAKNRPMTVIIYSDPVFKPVNPIGTRFDEWYTLSRTEKTPLGELKIYRRR